MTVTYGDTDKKVSASVSVSGTNGAISYAVKSGSGEYIDVDASTGALTVKKVPANGNCDNSELSCRQKESGDAPSFLVQ